VDLARDARSIGEAVVRRAVNFVRSFTCTTSPAELESLCGALMLNSPYLHVGDSPTRAVTHASSVENMLIGAPAR